VSTRSGEKAFGVAAIVAGVALVVATALGAAPSLIVLALIPLVVVGWFAYRRRAG
jgi:hypothetical protein